MENQSQQNEFVKLEIAHTYKTCGHGNSLLKKKSQQCTHVYIIPNFQQLHAMEETAMRVVYSLA